MLTPRRAVVIDCETTDLAALLATTVFRTCGIAREQDCSADGKPHDSGTPAPTGAVRPRNGIPSDAGFMHLRGNRPISVTTWLIRVATCSALRLRRTGWICGMRTRAIPAAKPGTASDITYRQHAIIESVIADVIDGPFGSSTKPASSPAGTFTASPSPWVSVAKLDDVSGSL